ncbi:MAG: hypothetical protein APG12_00379 [Candidatus Methanofastidiosum methylothiophilum]|uniref:Uncharacterized protein n=1 Tax=Candidatus Methanofastidiosum methylothiophilum TaxID=1705564 RepID=A0A150IM27_9EURY|nr:MAG: hypothetical protein APG10_00260 [Candidatus Methanofastidiosum methylthiophilus]KYC48287.1 MAG: hypothetical protein APG11_00410 [Candidatus Methanofastidiosum methylthiophilus]KYC50956.1 MAG: hypothetical protein APG12_00379 [Candidatus Methanofastidiosum methylthiophilus]
MHEQIGFVRGLSFAVELCNKALNEILENISQFKSSIKKLEAQGADVSGLKRELNRISEKIEHYKEECNEEILHKIRKEISTDCLFLRKKIIDSIKTQIDDIIKNEIHKS